eukprot:1042222_1
MERGIHPNQTKSDNIVPSLPNHSCSSHQHQSGAMSRSQLHNARNNSSSSHLMTKLLYLSAHWVIMISATQARSAALFRVFLCVTSACTYLFNTLRTDEFPIKGFEQLRRTRIGYRSKGFEMYVVGKDSMIGAAGSYYSQSPRSGLVDLLVDQN